MKLIAYELVGGKVEIIYPSIGYRLVSGVYDTVEEKDVEFTEVMYFDRAVAAYGGREESFEDEVAVLKPVWAESEEQFLARVRLKDVPKDAKNVLVFDPATLPPKRTYRNAWMIEDGALHVNMKAARILHMYRIRSMRNKKLKELDVAYIRADERGDEKAKKEIGVEKQRLRDLPKTFDLEKAKTAEQLEFLWPEGVDKFPES